jgi:hypothetical protein
MIVYPLGRFDNSPPPENLSRYVFVWHQKITLLYGKSYAQVSAATYHFIALRMQASCRCDDPAMTELRPDMLGHNATKRYVPTRSIPPPPGEPLCSGTS